MMGGSPLSAGSSYQINAIGLDFTPFTADSPLTTTRKFAETPAALDPVLIPPPFLPLASPINTPPPRPPRSPRRPPSPRIVSPPLPVVEDDNSPGKGVKTSPSASVLALVKPIDESPRQVKPAIPRKLILPAPALNELPPQTPPTPPPRPQCNPLREYQPLFLASAFERPRDPDEVRPQGPQPPPVPRPRHTDRRDRANAADVTPPPANPATLHVTTRNREPNPVAIHDRDRQTQNPDARRLRRTLYATNNNIHTWLQQIVRNNPPPRPRFRPSPPFGNISGERADTDPELREYGYDRTYDHADTELGD
ncbi:hypothetical protein EDB86DRAFT_2828749 [Lactarius hatsudake]|nr:hypothetical protein EDB86DRAFT_2828749 [Lactarius hatsudake]